MKKNFIKNITLVVLLIYSIIITILIIDKNEKLNDCYTRASNYIYFIKLLGDELTDRPIKFDRISKTQIDVTYQPIKHSNAGDVGTITFMGSAPVDDIKFIEKDNLGGCQPIIIYPEWFKDYDTVEKPKINYNY